MWPGTYYNVDSGNRRWNSHNWYNDKLKTRAPPSPQYRRRQVLTVNERRTQPEDVHVLHRQETRRTWRNPKWIVVAPLAQHFFLNIEQRDTFKEATTTEKALVNSKAVTVDTMGQPNHRMNNRTQMEGNYRTNQKRTTTWRIPRRQEHLPNCSEQTDNHQKTSRTIPRI